MAESPKILYVVGAIACAGLALSIHTGIRLERAEAKLAAPPPAGSCVDAEARREVDQLRRATAQRDAVNRLAQQQPAPADGPPAPLASGATPPSDAEPRRSPVVPVGEIRRYVHFEVPNPAVTVTQKEDGVCEVKTTDPSLAGTLMVVKATDIYGVEDTLTVKIPRD